jgi:hypothetical protein
MAAWTAGLLLPPELGLPILMLVVLGAEVAHEVLQRRRFARALAKTPAMTVLVPQSTQRID